MPPRRSSRISDKRPLSGHKAEGAVKKKLRTPQPKPKKKVSKQSMEFKIQEELA